MVYNLVYERVTDDLEGNVYRYVETKTFKHYNLIFAWCSLMQKSFDENYCNWLYVTKNTKQGSLVLVDCQEGMFDFDVSKYDNYSEDEVKGLFKSWNEVI